jgi:hypothetical protein
VQTPLDVSTTTEQPDTTAPTCDFCEAPNATFAYPVAAITIGADGETIPAAQWTACVTCHQLIEHEDWEGLSASAGYPRGFAPTPVTVFRENREAGPAVLLES